MKKVIVIGCPGSGKSTFSKKLNEITNIPLYHLDLMYWNNDKTIVEKEVFLNKTVETLKKESWIIDGNYRSTMELRIKEADTIFFLDYDIDLCLESVINRVGHKRSNLPWVEDKLDEEFIDYIKNYQTTNIPYIFELFNKYQNKKIYIFKNRTEAENFLNSINKEG